MTPTTRSKLRIILVALAHALWAGDLDVVVDAVYDVLRPWVVPHSR